MLCCLRSDAVSSPVQVTLYSSALDLRVKCTHLDRLDMPLERIGVVTENSGPVAHHGTTAGSIKLLYNLFRLPAVST